MTTAFCVSSASLSGTWLFGQGGISTHASATTFKDSPYSRKLNQLLARESRAHAAYLELQRREPWLGEVLPLEEGIQHHGKTQRTLVRLITRQSSLPVDASFWKNRLQSVIFQLSTNAPKSVRLRALAMLLDRLEGGLLSAYEELVPFAPAADRVELADIVQDGSDLRERLVKGLSRQ